MCKNVHVNLKIKYERLYFFNVNWNVLQQPFTEKPTLNYIMHIYTSVCKYKDYEHNNVYINMHYV